MNNPEFKKGDVVHFQAYPDYKPIKARVQSVRYGRNTHGTRVAVNGTADNRIFYMLAGIDKPLTTDTTGRCIVESIWFSAWTDLHEEATEKTTGEWQRPREISDRPEVVRDLVAFGYLECKHKTVDENTGATICFYRG